MVRIVSRQTVEMSNEVRPPLLVRLHWQIHLVLWSFAAILRSHTVPVLGLSTCPTGFFNFGDSLTDTGSSINAFPYTSAPEIPPYGESFFQKPSKRFSNGRVVPDFFSLAFGRKPLLQPYIQSGPFDYRFGVNFAYSGATATENQSRAMFYLGYQIKQFLRFKENTYRQWQQTDCFPDDLKLPTNEVFRNALYTFEIGGNDMIYASLDGRSPWEILNHIIPSAMKVIADGVTHLYQSGARRFLFFLIPNAGCSPIIMTSFGARFELDSLGCVKFLNDFDQAYNGALRSTIEGLRALCPEAQMDFFDYYGANEEILRNPTLYGFNPEKTKTACCGDLGAAPYSYDRSVPCGHPRSTRCDNPDQYVNWDGVHFTEQFYRTIAQFVLNGKFTHLGINYTTLCDLDYSLFESSATYEKAYPRGCKVSSNQKTPTPHHQVA